MANWSPDENWNKDGISEKAERGIKIYVWNTDEVSLSFCFFMT